MRRIAIWTLPILLLFPSLAFSQFVSTINPGTAVTSNSSLTVNNGTTFAVPSGRGVIISWQVNFTVAPTSITVQLQGSLDNSSFFSIDSTTTAAVRSLGPVAIKFIRCAVTAVTVGAGSGFTCRINVQPFNNAAIVSGGTLTSPLIVPAGTATAPGLGFTGNSGTGLYSSFPGGIEFSSGGTKVIQVDSTSLFISGTNSLRFETDARFRRTAANTVTFDNGAGGAADLSVAGNFTASQIYTSNTFIVNSAGGQGVARVIGSGGWQFVNLAGTRVLSLQAIDVPTCTTNCGTTPTVTGTGSSFTVTMGTTPASGFLITFPTAWAAAPQCVGSMALTGMVVGKLPLTLVTTTTTLTVVTNGTAPATADKYHFICSLGQ